MSIVSRNVVAQESYSMTDAASFKLPMYRCVGPAGEDLKDESILRRCPVQEQSPVHQSWPTHSVAHSVALLSPIPWATSLPCCSCSPPRGLSINKKFIDRSCRPMAGRQAPIFEIFRNRHIFLNFFIFLNIEMKKFPEHGLLETRTWQYVHKIGSQRIGTRSNLK